MLMTECRTVSPLLERYADDLLDARLTRKVSLHLASCAACRNRLEAVRDVTEALKADQSIAAPAGLHARVMDQVYRLALLGYPSRTATEDREIQRGASYRRLGVCFMLSAAVLAVSLVIPPLSYPTLLGAKAVSADLSPIGATVVKGTLADAARVVQGALMRTSVLREDHNGGNLR